jgi:Ran GTPase-activating protein (RanGAP) involved in mRNA processing and transport
MAEAIAKNRKLTDLDLSYNELRADAGQRLGKALEWRNSLTRLSVRKNSLGPEAGQMFASALRKNGVLT